MGIPGQNRVRNLLLYSFMITSRLWFFVSHSRLFSWFALALLLALALTAEAATKLQRTVLYFASGTFGVEGTLYTVSQATGAVLSTVGPQEDEEGHPMRWADEIQSARRGAL